MIQILEFQRRFIFFCSIIFSKNDLQIFFGQNSIFWQELHFWV